ncbi:MAG: hypothetical protein AAF744_07165 [Pseudomonadota bacterium]
MIALTTFAALNAQMAYGEDLSIVLLSVGLAVFAVASGLLMAWIWFRRQPRNSGQGGD